MRRIGHWSFYGPVLALPTAYSCGRTYLQGMLGNVVSLPEGKRWSQRHNRVCSDPWWHAHMFSETHSCIHMHTGAQTQA